MTAINLHTLTKWKKICIANYKEYLF